MTPSKIKSITNNAYDLLSSSEDEDQFGFAQFAAVPNKKISKPSAIFERNKQMSQHIKNKTSSTPTVPSLKKFTKLKRSAADFHNKKPALGHAGWLDKKVPGKDDDKIKRDKIQAMNARKEKNKPKFKSKKAPKKKASYHDDDDDSVNSFIVSDDEVLLSDEMLDEGDDDNLSHILSDDEYYADKKRKKKGITKANKKVEQLDYSEEEFDDDVLGEDEEDEISLDESDNSDIKSPTFAPIGAPVRRNRSRHANKNMNAKVKLSEEEIASPNSVHTIASVEEKNAIKADRTKAQAREDYKSDLLKKKGGISKEINLKKVRPNKRLLAPESREEAELQIALELSMQDASHSVDILDSPVVTKSSQMKRLKKSKEIKSVEPSNAKNAPRTKSKSHQVVDLENEDDPFDLDDDDANMKNLLATVNDLSAKVMARMQSFCQMLNTDTNNSTNVQSMNGMIVDGALALTQVCDDNNHDEDWLSGEELANCISPNVTLADYQIIGVNWMALMDRLECDMHASEESGKKSKKSTKTNVNGVLADEMGLGKTVQTIAFLGWLKFGKRSRTHEKENLSKKVAPSSKVIEIGSDDDSQEEKDNSSGKLPPLHGQGHAPHIVVVPASVLDNWMREFEKVCPQLNILKYHGNMNERTQIRRSLRKRSAGSPDVDVILTTFSYFSNERPDDREFFKKIKFDYMVVDEAHSLKNAKGKRYQELDKMRTDHRLLLTGTPVQNKPTELLALLGFLMRLFNDEKSDGGAVLLEQIAAAEDSFKALRKDAKTESLKMEEERVYHKLKQMLAPFVLRRRKADVLSQALPPKVHKPLFVPFDGATQKVYDSILESHFSKQISVAGTQDFTNAKHIFTSLRKAANHPLLLRTRYTTPKEVEELAGYLMSCGYFGNDKSLTKKLAINELANFSDFDIHCAALDIISESPYMEKTMSKYTLLEEDLFCSPKLERLRTFLPELVSDGHRILIFSQWTRCLDLLGCFLDSIQFKFLRLDGGTSIDQRQNLIDKFNNDKSIPVFLLSTRAGGMGINLTAADTCIIHDLDFNPFNDLQAEDRCHRIGQTKVVTVYKMITEATVDADIYAMQERKAEMTAAIFDKENKNNNQATVKVNKNEEEKEISNILKATFNRYQQSPKKKTLAKR